MKWSLVKRLDWLFILGVVAGAFVVAVSVSYYAREHFPLHPVIIDPASHDIPRYHRDFIRVALPWYDQTEVLLFTVVGSIVGAFLGALGVSALRALNRR